MGEDGWGEGVRVRAASNENIQGRERRNLRGKRWARAPAKPQPSNTTTYLEQPKYLWAYIVNPGS
jgi:hypothetical protein